MTTIKTLALIGLLAFASVFAHADTFTTLAVALDAKQQYVSLASGTNVPDQSNPVSTSSIGTPSGTSFTILYVDWEAMRVFTCNPPGTSAATVCRVSRGALGTRAKAHIANAKVWAGAINTFVVNDPRNNNLDIWDKGGLGAAVASGTSVTITNPITHITGTSEIDTIVVPPGFNIVGGTIRLIPDDAFTTGTSGNIAKASRAVANQTLSLTYDPVAAKWTPDY